MKLERLLQAAISLVPISVFHGYTELCFYKSCMRTHMDRYVV